MSDNNRMYSSSDEDGQLSSEDMNREEQGQFPQKYGYYHISEKREPEVFEGRAADGGRRDRGRGSGDFVKRLSGILILGLVFGATAALAFYAVNTLTARLDRTEVKESRSVEVADQVGSSGTEDKTADEAIPLGSTQDAEGFQVETEEYPEDSGLASKGPVAQVAAAAMPSVVAITTVSVQEIASFFYGWQEYTSSGSGSGIIVGEDDDELFIATNNHVVEGTSTVSVCFTGDDANASDIQENAVTASIRGMDAENDLAVVSVNKADMSEETLERVRIARIGDSDKLVVGEQVVAIGNALGYGQSVTSGWVSALNRELVYSDGTVSEVIQTDAAINAGNSGGALLNLQGEVIGINAAKSDRSDVEGVCYAIPISKAVPILKEMMDRETRTKVPEDQAAYLGVQVADVSSETRQMYSMPQGAFVTEAFTGEPADNAGIQRGDVITKLDGQRVTGRDDLIEKLQYYASGEQVEVTIARISEGYYLEGVVQVTLGSK